MEQSEREVYELVDLGYGRCTMVLATVAGEDRAAEALRRLGVMRIATKYPRIAGAPLPRDRPPGRDRRGQGLGRAGAADRPGRGDRRPHRDRHDAARERARGARGDRRLHGAADRQPGRAQAQGRARSTSCWSGSMRCERLDADRRPPRPLAARAARAGPGAGVGAARRSRRSSPQVRSGGDEALARLHAPVRHRRRRAAAAAGRRRRARRRRCDGLDAAVRAALERAIENVGAVAAAAARRGPGRRARPRTRWCCARPRCGRAGGLRARRARAVPEHGRDGRGDRRASPASRRSPCARRPAPTARSTRSCSAACRLAGASARLPDGRRAGDRRARLRDRDGRARST